MKQDYKTLCKKLGCNNKAYGGGTLCYKHRIIDQEGVNYE